MNGSKDFLNKVRVLTLAALAALTAGSVGFAQPVTTATLADGNSTALVDVGSSMGMYQWTIDGNNQLAQQWFWYRTGSGGVAAPINAIGGLSYNQAGGPNYLLLNYDNAQLGVQVEYTLTGGGFGQAQIKETITLINRTQADLDFHLFQYSDFDLAGSPAGDSIAITGNNITGFLQAIQTKGPSQIAETITLPYAAHAEASDIQDAIRNRLNTVAGLTLNDVTSAGPGADAAWAYQWDFVIPANSSVDVLKDKTLNVVPVPEPSSLGLIGLGLAALVLRRKQRA